jgi:hypothetical protein
LRSPDPQVLRRLLAAVGDDVVAHLGALSEGTKARLFDRGNMDKHVLAAGVRSAGAAPR